MSAEEEGYDGEEEYEEVSDEEKRRIVTHFLLSSPPGEIQHLLDELRVIVPASVLEEAFLTKVFQKYNLAQYLILPLGEREDGSNGNGDLIVCPDARIKDAVFLHPSTKKAVTVDHLSQRVMRTSEAREVDLDRMCHPRSEVLRGNLEKQLASYAKSQYAPERRARAATAVFSPAEDEFTVVISAQSVNIGAYWTGGWRSRYTVRLSGDSSEADVAGSVSLQAHYFEQGNVQMKDTQTVKVETVSLPSSNGAGGSADGSWANKASEAIVSAIAEAENKIQTDLGMVYVEMDAKCLKDMRRKMPVTGTWFDWTGKLGAISRSLGR